MAWKGCWIAPRRRCVVANRTDERRVEVIAALRRLRMTGAEIAECLGMALSTVSGILTRIGLGKLGRLGLEPASRYERERPGELIHSMSRSSADPGRRRQRVRAGRHRTTTRRETPPASTQHRRLGVRPHRHRRRHPPGLRRSPHRRESDHRRRLPPPGGQALHHLRHHRRAAHHRQRLAPTAPPSTPSRVAPSASDTYAHAPTAPRPTAKQNASSAPSWAAGPTARSTAQAPNATAALAGWLDFYNRRRPHGALSHKPPSARLNELNNLLGSYS